MVLNFIFAVIEKKWLGPAVAVALGATTTVFLRGGFVCFLLSTIFVPLAVLLAFFGWLILGSFKDGGEANWEEYLTIKDPQMARKYSKKENPSL
jgi:hypothetical protein